MYSELFKLIRTKDDMYILYDELKQLASGLDYVPERFSEVLGKVRKSISILIGGQTLSMSLSGKRDYIQGALNQLEKLKCVDLVLAKEPGLQLIENISDRIKGMVGENVVIDISVNKGILGGAILTFGGRYMNYSLASDLDKWMEKNYE